MVSLDMFDATSKVSEAISGFESETVQRIILMALTARELDGLLIKPTSTEPYLAERFCLPTKNKST